MTFNPVITSWNANGILSKTGELTHFLHKHKVHIMLINETKLTPIDTIHIKGYTIHRQDRLTQHTPAGGVAAIIDNKIPHTRVRLPPTSLESICIKLTDNTHIISIYNRPTNNFTQHDIHTLLNTSGKMLLIGDFNAKHTLWNCNRSIYVSN